MSKSKKQIWVERTQDARLPLSFKTRCTGDTEVNIWMKCHQCERRLECFGEESLQQAVARALEEYKKISYDTKFLEGANVSLLRTEDGKGVITVQVGDKNYLMEINDFIKIIYACQFLIDKKTLTVQQIYHT